MMEKEEKASSWLQARAPHRQRDIEAPMSGCWLQARAPHRQRDIEAPMSGCLKIEREEKASLWLRSASNTREATTYSQ